jgi:hypothetical protein
MKSALGVLSWRFEYNAVLLKMACLSKDKNNSWQISKKVKVHCFFNYSVVAFVKKSEHIKTLQKILQMCNIVLNSLLTYELFFHLYESLNSKYHVRYMLHVQV